MTVTVGIATTGEHPAVLRRTVERALSSASRVGGDVLVVVNGRGTVPQLAGLGPDVRVRYRPERGVAEARNEILTRARHDAVLFTDDDCAVPAGWCAHLGVALRGYPVVTAPVRMDVAGPVSAFFDHLRLFDATPGADGRPPLVVTASCGVRRDLVPVRFSPQLHTAGEDTQFGLALAAAGIPVTHLPGAPAVRHGLSERIEEITGRFLRNARSGPRLYLGFGHGEAAMPDLLRYYRLRIAEDYRFERRYAEIAHPAARTAFATYDTIFSGIAAVGYLDALGTMLDDPLIGIDHDALSSAWDRIASRVEARTAGLDAAAWAALDIDYRCLGDPSVGPEPLQAEVRAALRRHAVPRADDPTGRTADVLAHGRSERVAAFLRDQDAVRAAWPDLRDAATPVGADAAESFARSLGVPVKVAGDMAEMIIAVDASAARRVPGARR